MALALTTPLVSFWTFVGGFNYIFFRRDWLSPFVIFGVISLLFLSSLDYLGFFTSDRQTVAKQESPFGIIVAFTSAECAASLHFKRFYLRLISHIVDQLISKLKLQTFLDFLVTNVVQYIHASPISANKHQLLGVATLESLIFLKHCIIVLKWLLIFFFVNQL